MASADAVRKLLMEAPGQALCDGCLALACDMSLSSMRELIALLRAEQNIYYTKSKCAGCGRAIAAIAYSPK